MSPTATSSPSRSRAWPNITRWVSQDLRGIGGQARLGGKSYQTFPPPPAVPLQDWNDSTPYTSSNRRSASRLIHVPLPDAEDESLQRYKESLGLGSGRDLSDPRDPRVCIIHSLTMETTGRPPVTIDLSTPGSEATLKDKPFKIKEAAKFTMVASFRVQHEILSGLHYVQVVKRKGIRVSKDSEMIVCRGRGHCGSRHGGANEGGAGQLRAEYG